MEYVEILRSRRILTWWCAFIAAGLVLWGIAVAGKNMHVKGPIPDIPSLLIVAIVGFGAFILAAIVAPGLNNEQSTIAISWTRPMSRAQIAWRYVAVDLVTIALGSLVLALAVFAELAMARLSGYIRADLTILSVLEAIGCVVMWYALCVLAASRMPERAGMIAGLSWVVFILVGALGAGPLPPLIHNLFLALNYLNPLAYFSGSDKGELLAGSAALKTSLVWAISIVSLVAAVRLWSTREA